MRRGEEGDQQEEGGRGAEVRSGPGSTLCDDGVGGGGGVRAHAGVSSGVGRGHAGRGGGGRFGGRRVLLFGGLGELAAAFGAGGFPTGEGMRHL